MHRQYNFQSTSPQQVDASSVDPAGRQSTTTLWSWQWANVSNYSPKFNLKPQKLGSGKCCFDNFDMLLVDIWYMNIYIYMICPILGVPSENSGVKHGKWFQFQGLVFFFMFFRHQFQHPFSLHHMVAPTALSDLLGISTAICSPGSNCSADWSKRLYMSMEIDCLVDRVPAYQFGLSTESTVSPCADLYSLAL